MKLRLLLLLGVLVGAVLTLARPTPVSAHADLTHSEPIAGTDNATASATLRLFFSETPELKYCEIAVYDVNGQSYDQGPLQPIPGDSLGLVIAVRAPPQGVYTVS